MSKGVKIALGITGGVVLVLVLLIMWSVYSQRHDPSYPVSSLGDGNYGEESTGGKFGVSYMRNAASPMAASLPGGKAELLAEDSTNSAAFERMIIKTGQLSLLVKDVSEAVKNIVAYAESKGGFVVNSQEYKNDNIPYGVVTVRIPSKEFDSGVGEIKALGEVRSESINGQDVTEEYVDLDARKNNLVATEKQFLAILAKAQKISDILDVQRELSNVRGNIESLEGRMKYLRQNVEMSSLTVNLSTDPSVLPTVEKSDQWKPIVVLKEAMRGLIEVGKWLGNLVIWLVVFIPLWLFILLIAWLARRWYRRNKGY